MSDEKPPKSRSFASAAKMGAKLARLASRLKSETAARVAAEKDRDELKSRPDTAQLEAKVKGYQDAERAGRHRKAFDDAAKAAKVRPEALDDLWELSKIDTSAEEPDVQAIGAAVGEKVKSRPYLVGDASSAAAAETKPLERGPGSDRGGRAQSGGLTVKRSDLSDPQWMSAHQSEFAEHSAAGTLIFER